jgi:ankyrin repeat protein
MAGLRRSWGSLFCAQPPSLTSPFLPVYGNAFQAASYNGHEGFVRLLLQSGAEVNTQGGYYENELQAASVEGHEEIVRFLLQSGAEVSAQGGRHENAFKAASYGNHEQIGKSPGSWNQTVIF